MSDSSGFWPSHMLEAYKNISCMADGQAVTLSINQYRNGDHAKYPNAAAGGTQDAELVKDALLNVAPELLARMGVFPFVEVFVGKGSPWTIAEALSWLVDRSDLFIKRFANGKPPQRHVAALLADQSLSWQDTLQTICDTYLGLDCNGFVGNWLRVCEPHFRLGPNSKPDDVRRKKQSLRTTAGTVEYWDVLCWSQNQHIAVVETSAATPGRVWVCQSAGGGPRMNEYELVPTGSGTFRFHAYNKGDVGGDFYVVSLW